MNETKDPEGGPKGGSTDIPEVRDIDPVLSFKVALKASDDQLAEIHWKDIKALHNALVSAFDAFNLLDEALTLRANGLIEDADSVLIEARAESARGMNTLLDFSEAVASRIVDSAPNEPNTKEAE